MWGDGGLSVLFGVRETVSEGWRCGRSHDARLTIGRHCVHLGMRGRVAEEEHADVMMKSMLT